ncbi:lysoplasmalogenase [Phytomonospora sp. NPDC050363]|uniref:lysoplasmalogenase n=1 Tax=Phytomonospora sp. NPDC050363 TaxID=3155642 RepID=UPI0033E1E850
MKASIPRAALFAVTAVHLLALAVDWDLAATITKPLLMPLLAAYAWLAARPDRPRLLVAAVLCGWAGDVLLQFDVETAFLAGMGAFAAGHVCYQVLFAKGWRTRRAKIALIPYGIVWAAILAVLWPGLGDLRVPVAFYSLLLAATAVVAVGISTRAAVGGALFLVSDTLIAFGIADLPRPPAVDVLIMATYVAGQYLLVTGAPVMNRRAPALTPSRHDVVTQPGTPPES